MSTRACGVRVSPPRVPFEGSNGAWSMAMLGSHADQAPMTSARPLFNFVDQDQLPARDLALQLSWTRRKRASPNFASQDQKPPTSAPRIGQNLFTLSAV